MTGHRIQGDHGNSTVMVTALVVITLLLSTALLTWSAATRAAMTAATAADLAALVGADTLRGLRQGGPCAAAGDTASQNGAALDTCTIEGSTLKVTVSVPVRFAAAGFEISKATARARAGPPPLDAQ